MSEAQPSLIAEQVMTLQAARQEAREAGSHDLPSVGEVMHMAYSLPEDDRIAHNQGETRRTHGEFKAEGPLGEQGYVCDVNVITGRGRASAETVTLSVADAPVDLDGKTEKPIPAIRIRRGSLVPGRTGDKVQLRVGEKWRTIKPQSEQYRRLMSELPSVIQQLGESARKRQAQERGSFSKW